MFWPLSDEHKKFIEKHIQSDVSELALKTHGKDFPMGFLLNQIKCRQKSIKKLPSWVSSSDVVFHKPINVEQCSSEEAAIYKSNLIDGQSLVDGTGGFGVDTHYLAKRFKNVIYLEKDRGLCEIVNYNFSVLENDNITCINKDSFRYLNDLPTKVDWLYLDPARRDTLGNKTVLFEDCEPNVVNFLQLYLSKSKKLLIKASPMIDIKKAVESLKYVYEVHIVSIANECKEVLFLLNRDKIVSYDEISITCVDLAQAHKLTFTYNEEQKIENELKNPDHFLYLPNVAITKSGGYNIFASRHNVSKVSSNTHIYSSSKKVEGIFGRTFEVIDQINYTKKEMKALKLSKANVIVRNFPESVAQLRKKWSIKDGGEIYFIAFTDRFKKKKAVVAKLI